MTQEARDIARKIRALRQLTKDTGMITVKSQNELLRPLPNSVLTAVAEELAKKDYETEGADLGSPTR
jgi:hypothetical protein